MPFPVLLLLLLFFCFLCFAIMKEFECSDMGFAITVVLMVAALVTIPIWIYKAHENNNPTDLGLFAINTIEHPDHVQEQYIYLNDEFKTRFNLTKRMGAVFDTEKVQIRVIKYPKTVYGLDMLNDKYIFKIEEKE